MNIFWSIVIAVGLFWFIMWAEGVMAAERGSSIGLFRNKRALISALAIGLTVGIGKFFRPMLTGLMGWFSIPIFLIDTSVFVWLCYIWHCYHEEKREWKQSIPFVLATLTMSFVTAGTASTMVKVLNIPEFISSVFNVVPWLSMIGTFGYIIIDALYLRASVESSRRKTYTIWGRVFIGLICVILTLVLALNLAWGALPDLFKNNTGDNSQTQVVAANPNSGSKYRSYPWFLNQELQSDNTTSNDYYFGYQADKSKDRDFQYKDFLSRLDYDPMFVAAQAVTLDTVTGSDLIGRILYYGYQERNSVLERADAATMVLKDNKDIFEDVSSTIKAFYRDRATKIEWKNVTNLKNQIYADPYTIGGVPSLILAESDVKEDWCLIFYLSYGKDQTATVAFRSACGWQWVNCAETLGLQPKSMPISNPSNPGGGGSNPSPSSPTYPSPSPTSVPEKPTYNKDPKLGIDDPGNVEPGLDADTNNGIGATTSSEDRDSNSDHGSYDDYRDNIDQNTDANTGGGGSSSPGTDSNDDGGYTPRTDPAETGDGDIDNDQDNPGGIYGGPPD